MKKIILLASIFLVSAKVFAYFDTNPTPNQDLISTAVLGKLFCYQDNPNYGWAFLSNWTAVKIGVDLGMPGPDDYYKISFPEGPRAVGLFTVEGPHGSVDFQFHHDQLMQGPHYLNPCN